MFAPRGVGSWLLGKKRNNNRDTSRILLPDPTQLNAHRSADRHIPLRDRIAVRDRVRIEHQRR